ncbi:hypothetical protein NUW54_g2750 [Trametes sanguinea]|uniref:Uncharacterized protein n=1 Tax=Trametes sanguinea TaxID=158606 RepID=A0ACC1Q2Y0_9APHY|nr:hypothetical protein NUW54_g2750 [Trametes sanguinea]
MLGEGCIDPLSTGLVSKLPPPSVLRLNASALSDPLSLHVMLYSELIHLEFCTLVDSGSSHCFIDSEFVEHHGLPTSSVPPIQLQLFDGTSNNVISRTSTIPVQIPSGEVISVDFLVTPLDKSVSAVLGYSWLSAYNPLIDCKKCGIHFHTAPPTHPASSVPSVPMVTSDTPDSLSSLASPSGLPGDQPWSSPELYPPASPSSVPQVALVNTAAFLCSCRTSRSESYTLNLSAVLLDSVKGRSSLVNKEPPDLSGVPSEYHEFANVFSKKKADTLPEHWPYGLKITLGEGKVLPLGLIYSLSQVELHILREYIEENLCSGFIRPSNLPCRAPVLFIKKKDGSLRLCVDYRGLNKITWKDRYPLPLVSDLLDTTRKAWIYTKINLQHAYNLFA